MRLAQVLLGILWSIGYLGNGILFLYIEWTYLRQSFAQLFNLYLHLQVLGTLVTTSLFWIFLGLSVFGYTTASLIEKQLEKRTQKTELKADKTATKPLQIDQRVQFSNSSPSESTSQQVDTLQAKYVEEQVKLLDWAIKSSQKVQFNYEKFDGEKSDRIVTPISFTTVEKTLCLEGYCRLRHARRTFAIKRMRGLRIVSPGEANQQQKSAFHTVSTQAFSADLPKQARSQPQSVPNSAEQALPLDVSSKSRPYINYHLNEIERIVEAEWSNVQILSTICYELEFRFRGRSQALLARIKHRLTQLRNPQFAWPSTTANEGSQNLSSNVFKHEEGLLRQSGYRVGASGLPENQRRQILDRIFLQSLSVVNDSNYLREWGEPRTARRLQKLAESIAAFTRNAKRRRTNSFTQAIQDWESDLAYLKRTYYAGNFHFQWPRTSGPR